MKMVRKQIYLEPHQDAFLKRTSREWGISEAELIRRGIAQLEVGPPPFKPDREAWAEAKRRMVERASMVVPQTGRQWTREETWDSMPEPDSP